MVGIDEPNLNGGDDASSLRLDGVCDGQRCQKPAAANNQPVHTQHVCDITCRSGGLLAVCGSLGFVRSLSALTRTTHFLTGVTDFPWPVLLQEATAVSKQLLTWSVHHFARASMHDAVRFRIRVWVRGRYQVCSPVAAGDEHAGAAGALLLAHVLDGVPR